MSALGGKSRFKRFAVLGVTLAGLGSGEWYYWSHFHSPGLTYQTSTISRGDMRQIVTASGQLNPVERVEVGSQISGMIAKLFANFNSTVTQGQVIAQIDPASYQATYIQQQGNLASAKAGFEWAQINAERTKALHSEKLNPEADYDKALADLHQAEAAVKVNEGKLKKAEVDLARCSIYAPIDGVVISRNVNVGQTVAASLSAPTLFVIANDLSKMQIEANVAEADIGMVGVGQDAEFTVDAFPGQSFHGRVTQIRNAPNVDQSVVTYDTIIEVSNPNLKLKPGMTANVSIFVAQRTNALRIANAALRFHPPENAVVRKAELTSAGGNRSPPEQVIAAGRKKDKRKAERVVYVVAADSLATNSVQRSILTPMPIKMGITDGSYTEVVEGLEAGQAAVTGLARPEAKPLLGLSPFASNRKKP